jgi:hypothetical protein
LDGDVDANSLKARSKPNWYFICYVNKVEQLFLKEKEKRKKMKKVLILTVSLSALWSAICVGATIILHLGIAAGVMGVIGSCGVGASYWALEKFWFKVQG